jgi:ankyrin repeat protein
MSVVENATQLGQQLFAAAAAGDIDFLRSIESDLQPSVVHMRDDDGRTALMVAAQFGSQPFVAEIIRMGASTTELDHTGKSAYQYLEEFGSSLATREAKSNLDAAFIAAVIAEARSRIDTQALGIKNPIGDDIL